MLVFPSMLSASAEKAGMAVPPNPNDFDRDEYPHFAVFCAVQLGRPMEPTEHWDNAKVVADVSNEEIREIMLPQLIERGLRVKDYDPHWGEYEAPQEVCPRCQSDNIANEDAAEAGMLPVTCHNCSYQWVEPEVQ